MKVLFPASRCSNCMPLTTVEQVDKSDIYQVLLTYKDSENMCAATILELIFTRLENENVLKLAQAL